MAMNQQLLAAAVEAAAFQALQDAFLGDTPTEHQADVTSFHQRLAAAIGAGVSEVVPHLQQNAQATGTVSTTVSTTVATAGTAAAQTGAGTGTGTGTATIAPGGIT